MSSIQKFGGKSFVEATPLSDSEVQQLRAINAEIRPNIGAFALVGRLLAEIKDKRLYRAGGRTFEQFCAIEYGLSRQHSYRLIDDAATAAMLSPIGRQKPPNERIARELTTLRKSNPELVVPVYDAVTKTKARSTAREFHIAVKAVQSLGAGASIDEAVRVAKSSLNAPSGRTSPVAQHGTEHGLVRRRAIEVLEALRALSRSDTPGAVRPEMSPAEQIEARTLAVRARAWLNAMIACADAAPAALPADWVDEVVHVDSV